MSTRPMRLLRVVLLLGLLGGSLASASAGRASAQQLDGNIYTDDEYGWSVEFDDSVFTGEEVDKPTYRGINLSFDSGFGTLAVYDDGVTDPAACLKASADDFAGSDTFADFKASRTLDAPKTDRAAEGKVFTTTISSENGDVPLVFYIECREVDGGTLNVQLAAVDTAYEDMIPDFEDLLAAIDTGGVTPTRNKTPTPDDSSTRTGGTTGLKQNVYTSDEYGWSIEFDDRIWTADQIDKSGSQGVALSSDTAFANIVVYDDGITDAQDCLDDLDKAFTTSDGWKDVAPARRLDPPATSSDAMAELYSGTLVLDSGNVDVNLYLECREVDGATLSVTVTVPVDSYDDVVPDLEDLLASIDTSGGSSTRHRTPTPDDAKPPVRDDTPVADVTVENDVEAGELDGDTFTDSALNYTFTFDDRVWTAELLKDAETAGVFLSTDDEDLFATITVDASLGYHGIDPEQCVEDIATGYEGFDGYSSFRLVRNADGPEAPRDAASAVYSFTFTYDDGTDADLVAYIECRPVDDESMVRTTIQTTKKSLADNVDVFQEALDGIVIDSGG